MLSVSVVNTVNYNILDIKHCNVSVHRSKLSIQFMYDISKFSTIMAVVQKIYTLLGITFLCYRSKLDVVLEARSETIISMRSIEFPSS